MNKLILLIIITSLLLACEQYSQTRYCKEYSLEAKQWISDCIKNANPKSDEEPEDWILQCRLTATQIYCPMVKAVFESGMYEPCTEFNKEKCK